MKSAMSFSATVLERPADDRECALVVVAGATASLDLLDFERGFVLSLVPQHRQCVLEVSKNTSHVLHLRCPASYLPLPSTGFSARNRPQICLHSNDVSTRSRHIILDQKTHHLARACDSHSIRGQSQNECISLLLLRSSWHCPPYAHAQMPSENQIVHMCALSACRRQSCATRSVVARRQYPGQMPHSWSPV